MIYARIPSWRHLDKEATRGMRCKDSYCIDTPKPLYLNWIQTPTGYRAGKRPPGSLSVEEHLEGAEAAAEGVDAG
ncbi:MAG: hypothetical protein NC406_07610, partial [Bacteroides sp.]|nr:hypothetical protein [Bacteroides sp.]